MTGVSALSCFLTASGARSIDQPFGEMVLFGGFALFGFWHFKNCRAYLSMHSDEQISAHLNMCLKAFGTIVGPVVYLMAETIGCVSMFDSECELLFHCNFCVILHLVCGAVFFCLVGFTFAHQSWVDTLTFRNCDVNTFIRTIVGECRRGGVGGEGGCGRPKRRGIKKFTHNLFASLSLPDDISLSLCLWGPP